MDGSDDDTDRWNEGIDPKFINRLLAKLLIHWNYAWTDPVPVSNRIINTLPYIKYDENFHDERCPICLGGYLEKPRRSLTMLRCQHTFHRKCIIEWFMSASTCPNCRYDFPTDNQLYEQYKKLLEE
uniref:RING-type domain-containing protein n=1 Tax=Acrobeloides nanus TaxID=290746 RepID=A0A914D015_9BILA